MRTTRLKTRTTVFLFQFAFYLVLLCLLAVFFALPPVSLVIIALYLAGGMAGLVLLENRILYQDLCRITANAVRMRDEYNLKLRLRIFGSSELSPLARALNGFCARVHSTFYDLLNVIRENQAVAEHLNQTSEKYKTVAVNILERMDHIARSSAELSDSLHTAEQNAETIHADTNGIAGQITEQSAAMSETSSAVEELIANINNITRVINDRNETAAAVVRLKRTAAEKFREFAAAVNRIHDQIGSIGDSISVIRNIADSSGILAINASIEAANAGQAGKSFGVVARELKNLAENTQHNSSSIIKSLENIIREFTAARDSVAATDKVFISFSEAVQSFIDGMAEIRIGLNEMSEGTKEILTALETLNGNSQEVSRASSRISLAVTDFKTAMASLWQFGAKNEEYAKKSAEETAGISLETTRLANLGEQNRVMLEQMSRSMKTIKMTDFSELKASDGQDLLFWSLETKTIPPRPDDPLKYPETDRRHWYDEEYAGWHVEKMPLPESPMDGPEGKRIAYLFNTFGQEESAYRKALERGARKIAGLCGIELDMHYADLKAEEQARQVELVLSRRPDLVIIEPTDAAQAVGHIRRFYEAGIPVIVSLMAIAAEAYPYILCYTGPDDWGQTRALSREFADAMRRKGGYCIIQHVPGSGTDLGRTWGALTEISEFAPDMVFLEKTFTGFDPEPSDQTVTGWIKKYGQRLGGIIMADDNHLLRGVVRAIERAGRRDIVLAAAGNSKNGMDMVRAGCVVSITYQSAESTAALPIATAVEYFEGLPVPPVKKLPIRLIFRQNVNDFYPPQF